MRADPGVAVDRLDSGQRASGCHPRPQPGRRVRRRRKLNRPGVAAAAGTDFVSSGPEVGRSCIGAGRREKPGDCSRWTPTDQSATPGRVAGTGGTTGWTSVARATRRMGADILPARRSAMIDLCCRLWVMNADDGSEAHEFVPPMAGHGTVRRRRRPRSLGGLLASTPSGSRPWHSVVRSDGTGPVIQTGPKLSGTPTSYGHPTPPSPSCGTTRAGTGRRSCSTRWVDRGPMSPGSRTVISIGSAQRADRPIWTASRGARLAGSRAG